MKTMGKKITAALLSLAILVGMTACGGQGETTQPDGSSNSSQSPVQSTSVFKGTPDKDMVILNMTSGPTELNPMKFRGTIDQSILFHTMAGLTRLDGDNNPVADMAEKWEMNEDKTIYTMHLRKDAKWSNGEPVTANDFYYSWVMQMTPSTGSAMADMLYQSIKGGEEFYKGNADEAELGIKVIDEYTIEIEWARPMQNGLFQLAQPYFMPMNKKAYEEIGDAQYAKEAKDMVTNGAYKMTEWVHDSHIILEKNTDYYDAENIKVPKIKLVMIKDVNTNMNAFIAGEIDMCSLYSEQIQKISEMDKEAVQYYVDGGSWAMQFNLNDPYISNENLRKALAYSVDVQSLLDYVINDGSIAADGLVPSIISGAKGESYSEARGNLFAYDKEGAKGYLETALKELNTSAEELKLTFWATDSTYNKNQAAYLQQQWKDNLGLDVQIKSVPVQALTEAKINGDFSFAVAGWGPSENDAISFLSNFVSDNAGNYGKYNNSEYDALVKGATSEMDEQKRQQMLIDAEKMLIEDMAIGPMYFTCTAYGISDKLADLIRTPFQYFSLRDAHIIEG